MHSIVRKIGNSAGVVIPKPLLREIGVKTGDSVEMTIEDGRLVIAPLPQPGRQGWADDARRLAALGDDAPIWPDFANDDDAVLEW